MDKTQEALIKSIASIVAPLVFFGVLEYKANRSVSAEKQKRNELRALRREYYTWLMYESHKLTPEARQLKHLEKRRYIEFVANH